MPDGFHFLAVMLNLIQHISVNIYNKMLKQVQYDKLYFFLLFVPCRTPQQFPKKRKQLTCFFDKLPS